MELVFLNTLEKRSEERIETAQIAIRERQGEWQVVWHEPAAQGKPASEVWYEGRAWDELLKAFRSGMRGKLESGYEPLVGGALYDRPPAFERGERRLLLLQFAAESRRNEDCLRLLRAWRRDRAAREGRPAYHVATNRMLELVAAYLPMNAAELEQLPGFGSRKAELYGGELAKIVSRFPRETAFPLDWVEAETDMAAFEEYVEKLRLRKAGELERRRERKRRLLESVASGAALEEIAEAMRTTKREVIAEAEALEREGYDMRPMTAAELARIDPELREKAWQEMKQRGDRFLKPVLEALYTPEELSGRDLGELYDTLRVLRLAYRQALAQERRAGAAS
ncbi:HRDC domain-containing protein [Paenibacillus thermoaerophilus]|uniref:HRDC domain-containing protein n=1 Tax=Paenibacillus thermoaerophilus TaxID=1215385 RepID=A0ABW2V1C7_9BACL|nr:HRDC domain-containing protein [Paenibacillus thermoaerophilus]TMV18494.1 aldolase [Paenibacillus thermoaerophilus]